MTLIPIQFTFHQAPLSSIHSPIVAIVAYLTTIFSLQYFMRSRSPFKLKNAVLVHNLFLCLLSAAMASGVLIELAKVLFSSSPSPFRSTLCDPNGQAMHGRAGFWMYIFYVSKYYELLDTVIMVLRKRQLNFLHVYHHCIVLPLFYVYMTTGMLLQWIVVVANCTVHVAMYYYYAMSSMGKSVWWKKYITQAQIIQFIIDLTSTWPYPFLYFSSSGCSGSMRGWLFGQAVGASFFKLFSDFYVRSYRKSKVVHEAKNVDQPCLSIKDLQKSSAIAQKKQS